MISWATKAVVLGLVAVAGSLIALSSPPPAAAADKDCADFSNQAQAQDFFEQHGSGDPHNLDGDGDGKACEELPCPCGSSGSGGGGGGDNGSGGGHKPKPKAKRAQVVSVTDGDTVEVRYGGRNHDVRLIGIDTPEVFGGIECGGEAASRSMKKMLERGDRVKLIRDASQDNRDRYGRLLRYVQRNGADVGKRQVRRGWAKPYVYERPFQRVGEYRKARDKARQGDRGVWGSCGGDFHKRQSSSRPPAAAAEFERCGTGPHLSGKLSGSNASCRSARRISYDYFGSTPPGGHEGPAKVHGWRCNGNWTGEAFRINCKRQSDGVSRRTRFLGVAA